MLSSKNTLTRTCPNSRTASLPPTTTALRAAHVGRALRRMLHAGAVRRRHKAPSGREPAPAPVGACVSVVPPLERRNSQRPAPPKCRAPEVNQEGHRLLRRLHLVIDLVSAIVQAVLVLHHAPAWGRLEKPRRFQCRRPRPLSSGHHERTPSEPVLEESPPGDVIQPS
ncbi:predicted protein [Streptomyces viridosporus ATCC 14672]|uniref:Predicted protein n=1 Tax=Streptomyces viridosporus (strain ATCC 14672 / DSM 40746 / JCM 4963 / KCTC 9882 / NRRL B-12104 / FH 1290) TaxID=566461 RepID=D6A5H7_STRV1|nr:predicted protein [Streptomyces viridosporus ATCC 14672]